MNILECINKNTINNIFNFVLGTSYSMSFINNKISKYNVYVNYITKNENGINASLKVINENIKINIHPIIGIAKTIS